jgi:HD-like signal output (HDOD) protein/DNA-binding response OmpR family regulator
MKHIVFVDDERELLDGLRARLYKHRHDWNMTFLLSGEEAIATFERQPVDLIVSDVRMPGMDGGQLLTEVKERWPTTVRIIVSGYADPVQAVRLTSLAHQYIAKPCDGQQLENIVERCFNLQELLSEEPLRQLVGRIGKLPALPRTYGRLQAALSKPSVTAAEIGDIVNSDPAIASKVLQITNSAFFRLRKPMVRIKDAVTYLGFATIRNLVLSAEIVSQWRSTPTLTGVDPEQLQNHAQYAAAACKSLAGGRVSPDDAWLTGLLHDIGYWVLIQECPHELQEALELARAEQRPLVECERHTIGATHAQIGAYLLGLWGLPYSIVEAVALHHTPRAVNALGYDLLGALAVAHALLESTSSHALLVPGKSALGVDAEYLVSVQAPFDWEEAQRRLMDPQDLPNILCVDDEPRVVEGLALHLRRDYHVLTAGGGQNALALLKEKGAPAVIVSDMRMPGMDGAALLKQVKHLYPETTRILLTGDPGRDAAMAAVNEGQIFRFLMKPCPPDQLRAAIEAGVSHHRLLRAEKVLLQETLVGCIRALVDVLAITNPVAFGRTTRIKRLTMELAAAMGQEGFWQLDAAAMLSQIGYISLPVELVEKLYYAKRLTAEERVLADGAPAVAQKLLGRIPRLEPVLEMLAARQAAKNDVPEGLIKLGAGILRLVLDYDARLAQGLAVKEAIEAVRANPVRHDAILMERLEAMVGVAGGIQTVSEVCVGRVTPGMVFMEDLRTSVGALLVPKGFEVTETFLERMRNFGPGILQETVRVTGPVKRGA